MEWGRENANRSYRTKHPVESASTGKKNKHIYNIKINFLWNTHTCTPDHILSVKIMDDITTLRNEICPEIKVGDSNVFFLCCLQLRNLFCVII